MASPDTATLVSDSRFLDSRYHPHNTPGEVPSPPPPRPLPLLRLRPPRKQRHLPRMRCIDYAIDVICGMMDFGERGANTGLVKYASPHLPHPSCSLHAAVPGVHSDVYSQLLGIRHRLS